MHVDAHDHGNRAMNIVQPRLANTKAAFVVADALRQMGVVRIFGVPGGGSSLDLIEGAKASSLPFVLARQETAGVIMAAVTADLSGAPGAALVTRGPGVANAANGMACAALDRSPVFLLTDGFAPEERGYVTHQWFDQIGMLAPVTKAQARLTGGDAAAACARLFAAALTPPLGPVVIEMSGEAAQSQAAAATLSAPPVVPLADQAVIAVARRLLAAARRPALVLGLEARDAATCAAVRALTQALGCPALVTYKAKGVLPDEHELHGGIFTGGAAEAPLLSQADFLLLIGADPVEFIGQPWRYTVPVVDVSLFVRPVHYLTPTVSVVGALAPAITAIAAGATRSTWDAARLAAHRATTRAALAYPGDGDEVGPQRVVELAWQACRRHGVDARATVDAGAHMVSATSFWPCRRPNDLLISNGLATMGYALPAAIAAALFEPARPAIAFTGDGGLAMCLGELATAVGAGAKIVVIVFNDGGLSLIDLKRGRRDLPDGSLTWRHADFAQAMQGMGGLGIAVRTVREYAAALDRALTADGPALIDVRVDPACYARQLRALRG
jgi:acetolactate synthase-1/2/3 large subunit